MENHKTNLGVKDYEAKGGKCSLGLSESERIRVERHKAFVKDMSCLPPANSNERARYHRYVLARHNHNMAKLFRVMKLEC